MNVLYQYSHQLNKKGIDFKLIDFVPEKKEWKYQVLCIRPINTAEDLDNLFKGFYQFVGDLILDEYDVEIVDDFNFLIRELN